MRAFAVDTYAGKSVPELRRPLLGIHPVVNHFISTYSLTAVLLGLTHHYLHSTLHLDEIYSAVSLISRLDHLCGIPYIHSIMARSLETFRNASSLLTAYSKNKAEVQPASDNEFDVTKEDIAVESI